jgi:hypothetical protein
MSSAGIAASASPPQHGARTSGPGNAGRAAPPAGAQQDVASVRAGADGAAATTPEAQPVEAVAQHGVGADASMPLPAGGACA